VSRSAFKLNLRRYSKDPETTPSITDSDEEEPEDPAPDDKEEVKEVKGILAKKK